jgi:hypothetical protein
MVAAELNATRSASAMGRCGVAHTVALIYIGVWTLTLAVALATCVLGVALPIRALLGLRLSPTATGAPTPVRVAALALHNSPVCGWPLLLVTAGARRSRRWTSAAHALVAGSLCANAALVGVALGAYGPALLAYAPQLPLEWLALAAGGAGWLAQHARFERRERVRLALLVLYAVVAAAVLEVYAVPHSARDPAAETSRGVEHGQGATYGRAVIAHPHRGKA